jgi:hypothetical protein
MQYVHIIFKEKIKPPKTLLVPVSFPLMKNPLSLRKRGVPRSKPQLGHHYIPKPADAALLRTRLKVLHFIHDTNQKKIGK